MKHCRYCGSADVAGDDLVCCMNCGKEGEPVEPGYHADNYMGEER